MPVTLSSIGGTLASADTARSRGQTSLRLPVPCPVPVSPRSGVPTRGLRDVGGGGGATSPLGRQPAAVAAGPAGPEQGLRAAEGASPPSIAAAADMKALGGGPAGGGDYY